MAEGTISDEQWLELYRHLLTRLKEGGFDELRAEIEEAAAAPVIEKSTAEDEARIPKMLREKDGRAVIRRRAPEEVFKAAVGVLQTRLVELPAVADSVVKRLGFRATQMEFRVDYEHRYALVESESISPWQNPRFSDSGRKRRLVEWSVLGIVPSVHVAPV